MSTLNLSAYQYRPYASFPEADDPFPVELGSGECENVAGRLNSLAYQIERDPSGHHFLAEDLRVAAAVLRRIGDMAECDGTSLIEVVDAELNGASWPPLALEAFTVRGSGWEESFTKSGGAWRLGRGSGNKRSEAMISQLVGLRFIAGVNAGIQIAMKSVGGLAPFMQAVDDASSMTKSIRFESEKKEQRNGQRRYLYAMQNTETTDIKIGVSYHPNRRMRELQNMGGCELKLLVTVHGDEAEESVAHQHFAEYRKHGEWFTAHESIVQWVDKLIAAAAWVDPRPESQRDVA